MATKQEARLKQVRKILNFTQQELAEALGITVTSIRRYEYDTTQISKKTALALKGLFGVNPTWLLTGEGEMFLPTEDRPTPEKILQASPQTRGVLPVPVINLQVPAGFPEMPLEDEQIQDYLYLPFGEAPSNAMAVKVKGHSMSPTIEDGEYVIFLPAGMSDVRSGDIVIVRNEWNELILKRFREKYGEMFLVSDNPKYPTIKPNEEYTIVGKVIKKVTVQNL